MDVSREDLHQLRDEVLDRMREGFEGTHRRLDVMNGRVGRVEAASAGHAEAIETLKVDRRDLWAAVNGARAAITRGPDRDGRAAAAVAVRDSLSLRAILGLIVLATGLVQALVAALEVLWKHL